MLGWRRKGKTVPQANKPPSEIILDPKERGDVGELKRVLDSIGQALALPEESYAPLLAEARNNQKQAAPRFPKELRDAAEASSLEFRASPPYYRVGCFTLRQNDKKPDLWDLSALDNVVVASVQAFRGEELVKPVLEHITAVEAALKQAKPLGKDLKANYGLLADTLANTDHVPPNLLLALMNIRGARGSLVEGGLEPGRPLSRAAFGYVLAKIQKDPETSALGLELKPATQLETAKPHTYVSVPVGSLDPPSPTTAPSLQ